MSLDEHNENETLHTVESFAEKVKIRAEILYKYINSPDPGTRLNAVKLGHTTRVTFKDYFDWLFSLG